MLDKFIGPQLPSDPAKIRPHPIANEFPMMDGPDYEGLKASIKAQGFLVSDPIWLYGDPLMILDGRNRQRAANELGLVLGAKNYRVFVGTYEEAEAFSNAKNGHRRHLTSAQKEERVKAYIAKHPNAGLREIARACGVSHNTVKKYKEPPGEEELKKLMKLWGDLSDELRARFVKECAADLRALL
jgi:ParB-like chromosome segregation protein Spo0J